MTDGSRKQDGTFSLDAPPLPHDEIASILPPPLDLRPREAIRIARQSGVGALVHRHVGARHLGVDVGRNCGSSKQTEAWLKTRKGVQGAVARRELSFVDMVLGCLARHRGGKLP